MERGSPAALIAEQIRATGKREIERERERMTCEFVIWFAPQSISGVGKHVTELKPA